MPHKFHLYLILIISFALFDKLIKTCFYLPFYHFKILANNEEDKHNKVLNGYSLTSPVLVCKKAKEQKVNITNSKMELTLNFNSISSRGGLVCKGVNSNSSRVGLCRRWIESRLGLDILNKKECSGDHMCVLYVYGLSMGIEI